MKATVNIIKDIVNSISATVYISLADNNGDGTFTLFSDNTWWLSKDDIITIGVDKYRVNSFEQNVSFTITPTGTGVLPTATSFNLQAPTYIHGTLKMAKHEVDAIKDKMGLVPFIYLYEVLRDKKTTNPATAIDRETTLRIFFLNTSSFKDMLTEDVYLNILDPLQTMFDLFITKIKASKYFADNMDYDNIPLVNFSEEGNQQKSIFDVNLSGIELRLDAEIRKDLGCGNYIPIDTSCQPVTITDGLDVIDIVSGGTYTCTPPTPCADATYTIKDSADTTLYSGSIAAGGDLQQTITDAMVNINQSDGTLLEAVIVKAEGVENRNVPDSLVAVNGVAFANVKSTDGLNVPVQYADGTPVGTIVGGVVVIPNCGTAPQFTANPVITASAFEVGQTLTCSDGTVTGTTPINYTYQWKQNGLVLLGETNNTYTTVSNNVGEDITCTVTATNAFGSDTADSNIIVVTDTLESMFSDFAGRNMWAAEDSTEVSTTTTWIDYAAVHNVLNPAATNQPTTNTSDSDFGNRKSATFLTDDFLLKTTPNYGSGQTSGSMWFVFKTGPTIKTATLFAASDEATTTDFIIFYFNGSNQLQFQTSSGTSVARRTDVALTVNTTYICQIESTGSAINIYVNGSLVASTVVSGADTGQWFNSISGMDNITIGVLKRTSDVMFYDGKIALVGNYPLLSAAQRNSMFNRLNKYYGNIY